MILGRTEKLTSDRHRVVVDFFDWLDPGEGVSEITDLVIGLDAGAWENTRFGATPPADTTPLTVFSQDFWDANTKLVLLFDAGTPELVYLVTFIATGGTSGRKQTVAITIAVHEALDVSTVESAGAI